MKDNRFHDSLNFRDLGDLETNDGRKVRKNLFYRGSGLNFFNDDELEEFRKIGIRTIMDLRSNIEIITFPDPEIENAKRIEHNGLTVEGHEDIDWSPAGMRKIGGDAYEQISRIHSYYRRIAFGNNAFRLMIKEIEDEKNLPLYFHCATGKDRTGVAAMIILMLLNVKEELIRNDYLVSNEYRKDILAENYEEAKEQIEKHPELKTLITMQQGVVEEIYDIVMASILNRYDSFDEYIMKEFSISEEKLKELRDRYLTD